MSKLQRADITGVVLCGGRGTRMGGVDKGLVAFEGRTLVEHALARLGLQVGPMIVSANRNLDRYAALGHPVVTDANTDFDGPLAGIAAAARNCSTEWLASVPCDVPWFADDLVARLADAVSNNASAAIAIASGDGREHPVLSLMRRETALSIDAYLASGERRVMRWMQQHGMTSVAFDDASLRNVNSPDDLPPA